MIFSSTTEYALRAAVHLASIHGEAASSERIAESTKVPSGYLSKVMRDLVVAGIASSQRGPNGGFVLTRDPSKISILEVVDAVTPIQRIRSCPLGNPVHLSLCPLHRKLDDAIESIQKAFESTTLADLLQPDAGKNGRCAGVAANATLTVRGAAKSTRSGGESAPAPRSRQR